MSSDAADVAWFTETADTFSANADNRWSYAPGTASAVGSKIAIDLPDPAAGSMSLNEVSYAMPTAASASRSVTLDFSRVIFSKVGQPTLSLDSDSTFGLQVVSTTGGNRFAIYNPTLAVNAWIVTDVPATLSSVEYDVRVRIVLDGDSKKAIYSYSTDHVSYSEIGSAAFPPAAALPGEIGFLGQGSVEKVSGVRQTGAAADYERWSSLAGVLSWQASGAAGASADPKSDAAAKFCRFAKKGDAWSNDVSVAWSGPESTTYSNIPGYSGTAPIWKAFSNGQSGYVAPGLALRFAAADASKPGSLGQLSFSSTVFSLGGLIVESGATGHSIVGEDSSSVAKTHLGDPAGAKSTWFWVAEDFAISRGTDASSEAKVFGAVNFSVEEGKTLSVNAGSSIPLTLDVSTHATAAFHGDGALSVSSLVATGDVTLDFSDVDLARSSPFVIGDIKVDGSTHLKFPASFAPGSEMKLCSGSVSGIASGLRTITVGGVDEYVFLAVSGNVVTRYETVARATITRDVAWSAIPWDVGCEWRKGMAVELDFENASSVLIDSAVTAGGVTISGAAVGQFDCSRFVPEMTALVIPEGVGFSLAGGDESEQVFASPLEVAGTLVTTGRLRLSNAANAFAATSALTAGGGALALADFSTFAGELSVASGATLQLGKKVSPKSVDVSGTLDVGATRLTANSSCELTLRGGALVTGTTGELNFDSSANGLKVADDGTGGEATIACNIRLSQAAPFVVNGSATLTLANEALVSDMHKGFCKSGTGTLRFASAANTAYSSVVTVTGGAVDFPSGFTFNAPLTLNSGVIWIARGTAVKVSGAFTLSGPLMVDGSAVSSDAAQLLEASDLSSLDIENVFSTDGAWKFSKTSTILSAIRKGSSERTVWDYSLGVFSYESTGGAKFQEATYKTYDPVTSTKGTTAFVASTLTTELPGWKGVSTYPWQLFSSAESKGRVVDPGCVMCFLAAVNGQTIPALLTQNERDNLHFAGLLVAAGASNIVFNSDSDANYRSTRFGDRRGSSGAETRFELHESLSFSRRGAFEFFGKVNLHIDEGKTLDANSARSVEVCRPTLATGAELKMHGAGTLTVQTLVASGSVVLDYSDLDLSRTTPYVTGGASGGNLLIDASTRFRFPAGLETNVSYRLCSGDLIGATDGARLISVGTDEFYANLTFVTNTVSYAKQQVNTATLAEGLTRWQDIVWNGGGGWIDGAPVVITLTGDARLSHLSSDLGTPRVIFDGPYQIGFGYDSNLIGEVVYQNGATPVSLDYVWTGAGDGASWEDAANWSSGVVPSTGALAQFGYSANVSAKRSVACALSLASSATLELTLAADSRIDGVSGGALVKRGAGNLVIGADSLTGLSVSGSKITSEAACVIFEGMSFRNLALKCAGGRFLMAKNGVVTVDGQLAVEAEEGVSGKVFEQLVASGDGSTAIRLAGSATIVKSGAGLVAFACRVGSESSPYGGNVSVDGGTLSFDGFYGDEINSIGGVLSGEGRVGVGAQAVLRLASATLPSGGFAGSGKVIVGAVPSSRSKAFSSGDWVGTLSLEDALLNAFYPAQYGNLFSTIGFKRCSGSLRTGSYEILPAISLDYDSSKPALELTSALAGDVVTFRALEGDGELRLSYDAAEAPESGATVDGSPVFTGSYSLSGGDIDVTAGTAVQIGPLASWSAGSSGWIDVRDGATVTSEGLFLSQVIGGGLVNYSGTLDSRRIEEAACFTYQQTWTGTVCVTEAILNGARLDYGVNDNSRLVLSDARVIDLPAQRIRYPVTVSGLVDILSVSEPVVFSRGIAGDGKISVFDGSTGSSWWVFEDVWDYTGAIAVGNGEASIGIGIGETTAEPKAGSIVYGEAAEVQSSLGWRSHGVAFGSTLKVYGEPEDTLLNVSPSAPYDDYAHVRITLDGDDERIIYTLALDQTTGDLRIAQGASPPTMDISSVEVAYGVDMTNATVYVTVANYWSGIDYSGPNYIRVWIYDSDGNPYDVLGGVVAGDGVYAFGTVALPRPNARDYTYRVEITARESDYSDEELVDSSCKVEPLACVNANWIRETHETFPAEAKNKTGVWTWTGTSPGEHLFADGEAIRVRQNASEPDAYAQFEANEKGRGVVRYEIDFTMDGSAVEPETPLDAQGAISINEDDNEIRCMNPESGAYEVAEDELVERSSHHLVATFNYCEGTVCYELDGRVLTTAEHPTGRFALKPEQIAANAANGVCFAGGDASIGLLAGVMYGTNLVQSVIAEKTNEWQSLDAAIADLTERGISDAKLKLFWDSYWAPQTNSLGSTFRFDTNGFDLLIDPAVTNRLAGEGYRVVQQGDDGYRIDLISYELSFHPDASDATGSMAPAYFTATNRVVKLPANAFQRLDFDFSKWGDSSEGLDNVTYEDEEVVDLTPFGLKDVGLYARWKVKVRTITIEPTDEYVYIEYVETNGYRHAGVQYFGHDDLSERAKGRGKALIPVMNGSDLVIRFSTDLEKMLDYDKLLSKQSVVSDGTLSNKMPEIITSPDQILSEIQYWAMTRGISLSALAKSAYSTSSFRLDRDSLLTDETVVEISDFTATATGCTFSVKIDGEPLNDPSRILGMVQVADRLDGNWEVADDISVDSDTGLVTVGTTKSAKFVKIVIPKNDGD